MKKFADSSLLWRLSWRDGRECWCPRSGGDTSVDVPQ